MKNVSIWKHVGFNLKNGNQNIMTTLDDATSSKTRQPAINGLTAVLLPDGKRVRVTVTMQDTSRRPDLELVLEDANQQELSHTLLMGIFLSTAEFTLHNRNTDALPPYTITASLKSSEDQILSRFSCPVA
jgi:hypothetical protein